jgi:uncharacterized protein (DUF2267 family)
VEDSLASILGRILRCPEREHKLRFHQELERVKVQYELTPPGYAREILLGTYKILKDKYQHNFEEEFDNSLHRRIQQDVVDKETVAKYRRKK